MAEWYLRLGGRSLGPYDSARFAEMAIDGRLIASDPIRRGDMTGWVPAAKLKGISFPPELPSSSGAVSELPPPLPPAEVIGATPTKLNGPTKVWSLLKQHPSRLILGLLLFVSIVTVQWPFGSAAHGRRFERELRSVVAAGRPAVAAKSTPRIDGVTDGVARGFAGAEYLASQLVIAAFADLKSSAEGDKLVDALFVILGDSDSEIQGYIARNDPRDFQGRVALTYTVAERLRESADHADEKLAQMNFSAKDRANIGPAYRRVCNKLADRFEAGYKKMISEGGHLLAH